MAGSVLKSNESSFPNWLMNKGHFIAKDVSANQFTHDEYIGWN